MVKINSHQPNPSNPSTKKTAGPLWSFTSWWFQPHLKNISRIGLFPQVGMTTKNIWNHHPVDCWTVQKKQQTKKTPRNISELNVATCWKALRCWSERTCTTFLQGVVTFGFQGQAMGKNPRALCRKKKTRKTRNNEKLTSFQSLGLVLCQKRVSIVLWWWSFHTSGSAGHGVPNHGGTWDLVRSFTPKRKGTSSKFDLNNYAPGTLQ